MKQAVIDLGSNTVRLSVYEIERDGFKRVFTQKISAGLAGYIQNGLMTDAGIMTAADALKRLLQQANMRAQAVNVFATAAIRNVNNSAETVLKIERITGAKIEVLSGKEEGMFALAGARRSFPEHDGTLFDVGGGSTEVVRFAGEAVTDVVSLELGSMSLFKQFVLGDYPTKIEIDEMKRKIDDMLSKNDVCRKSSAALLGVGGSIRALDVLGGMLISSHVKGMLEDCELFALEQVFCEDERAYALMKRRFPERASTIIPGMLIITSLMRMTGGKRIYVSKFGVREGYVIQRVMKKL